MSKMSLHTPRRPDIQLGIHQCPRKFRLQAQRVAAKVDAFFAGEGMVGGSYSFVGRDMELLAERGIQRVEIHRKVSVRRVFELPVGEMQEVQTHWWTRRANAPAKAAVMEMDRWENRPPGKDRRQKCALTLESPRKNDDTELTPSRSLPLKTEL